MKEADKTLILNPYEDIAVFKALASDTRLRIVELIHRKSLNINEIAQELELAQSTVATYIKILEDAGLVVTDSLRAKRGNQKVCRLTFDSIRLQFPAEQETSGKTEESEPPAEPAPAEEEAVYSFVPDDANNQGSFEYKFPDNLKAAKLNLCMELSAENPGMKISFKMSHEE